MWSGKSVGQPYQVAAEELRKNPQQWAAYESKGHCVVLAGPGSGKTKVLTLKLARLIAEEVAAPRGVACLTYNNECVKELTKRLGRLRIRNSANVFVGTVHSFCLRAIILTFGRLAGLPFVEHPSVASSVQANDLFGQALRKLVGADEKVQDWRRLCDAHRRSVLDRNSPDWLGLDPRPAKVIEQYERFLRDRGLIDFEDMVLLGLRLVEDHPWVRRILSARFPVMVVDEYQDLGLPLHRLVRSLCFSSSSGCRLFAVGDHDQSIYSFTGAEPDLLLQVARDERVERVQLRLNYRSRSQIIEASEIALGEHRGYEAANGDGGVLKFFRCKNGLRHQAEFVVNSLIPKSLESGAARNLGEIAVLYRDKTLGDIAAEIASAANLQFTRSDANAPYRCTPFTTWLEQSASWCAGGWKIGVPSLSDLLLAWRWFNRTTTCDSEMLADRRMFVRFLFDHRDTKISLREWLGFLHESCLRRTFEREPLTAEDARHFGAILEQCGVGKSFYDWSVARFSGQSGTPDHLNLMTFHSSKGLEFDVVFMLGLDQGIIPGYRETTLDSKKEPRRLFYVAMTRARNEVHLLCSGWRDTPFGPKNDGTSEFVREIYMATQVSK
jgi:DNA helicase II / ATP-dependent DNA helicase PcrA